MSYAKEFLSNRRLVIPLSGLVAANIIVFGLTSPFSVPVIVVLAGFLVGLFNLIAITYFCLVFLRTVFPSVKPHTKKLLIALASFEFILLALASLGQLTVWAVIIIVLVWVIAYFYSSYFVGFDDN